MLPSSPNTSEKHFSIDKISLAITACVFIVITFLFRDIPFFWDGALYCQVAHYYYDTNFHSLILPPDLDAYGSPMIFWMYVAGAWKIFGKTLLVSHLILLPFLLGVTWEYYKLAKKFLSKTMIPWAMLLLICEPTFMTQSIVMSYDISKLYFFLLGLNSLLNKNKFLYSVSIILLSFCSTRGLMMTVFLIPIHFFLYGGFRNKKIIHELKVYFFPTVFFLAWVCFHKSQTGWFFYSMSPEFDEDRNIADVVKIFHHSLFVVWQILDLGRVFIWIFIAYGLLMLKKRNLIPQKMTQLLIIIFILFLLFVIAISPLAGDVCHRYFIILFFLSHILAVYLLQEIVQKKVIIYLLIGFLSLGLITGNFWMYGGGLSNAWDSSLKVLPYFKLRDQMIGFTKGQNISPQSVGTKYPMHQDLKYTDLQKEDFHFTEIGNDSLGKFQFILFSNVSNLFTAQEKNKLKEWKLVKEYDSGQIFLKLFQNPMSN